MPKIGLPYPSCLNSNLEFHIIFGGSKKEDLGYIPEVLWVLLLLLSNKAQAYPSVILIKQFHNDIQIHAPRLLKMLLNIVCDNSLFLYQWITDLSIILSCYQNIIIGILSSKTGSPKETQAACCGRNYTGLLGQPFMWFCYRLTLWPWPVSLSVWP